jgi:hypothetical protein
MKSIRQEVKVVVLLDHRDADPCWARVRTRNVRHRRVRFTPYKVSAIAGRTVTTTTTIDPPFFVATTSGNTNITWRNAGGMTA